MLVRQVPITPHEKPNKFGTSPTNGLSRQLNKICVCFVLLEELYGIQNGGYRKSEKIRTAICGTDNEKPHTQEELAECFEFLRSWYGVREGSAGKVAKENFSPNNVGSKKSLSDLAEEYGVDEKQTRWFRLVCLFYVFIQTQKMLSQLLSNGVINLINSAKRIQLDRLQAEYERLDKVLLEVIADMAVLKYELDLLETPEN